MSCCMYLTSSQNARNSSVASWLPILTLRRFVDQTIQNNGCLNYIVFYHHIHSINNIEEIKHDYYICMIYNIVGGWENNETTLLSTITGYYTLKSLPVIDSTERNHFINIYSKWVEIASKWIIEQKVPKCNKYNNNTGKNEEPDSTCKIFPIVY